MEKFKPISEFAVNDGWHKWYEHAEALGKQQFATYIEPILTKIPCISLHNVLDFACGHGRMASQILPYCNKYTCCDVNKHAIEFCMARFKMEPYFRNMSFCINQIDGENPKILPFNSEEFTMVFTWDSMVHFPYSWLEFYIPEFYRVLLPGGFAIIHHSNLGNTKIDQPKNDNFMENIHWRTKVSDDDVREIANKAGFIVPVQQVIDWQGVENIDCITILRKGVSTP